MRDRRDAVSATEIGRDCPTQDNKVFRTVQLRLAQAWARCSASVFGIRGYEVNCDF